MRLLALEIRGAAGERSLAAMQDRLGVLPRTREERIESGRRLIFELPAKTARLLTRGELAPGLSWRCVGGSE